MTPSFEEKIQMAKEANPDLTDKQAVEVVRDLEQFAYLALDILQSEKNA